MSKGKSELKSAGAMALRAAGYLPLPRLWVKPEDLDMIVYMAKKHEAEVNRIRNEANGIKPAELSKQEQIDLAWASIQKE